MRRTVAILAAGLSACIAQAALAADMPLAPPPPPIVIPVYSWTGCYIGGNVGGHWGSDKITTTSSPNNGNFFDAAGAGFFDSLTPTTYHPQGVAAGLQAGCNLQTGRFVVGLEADADWLNGTLSRTVVAGVNGFIAPNDYLINSTKATFLATARARVGVAVNRMLLYVTGGAAFGTIKTTDTLGTFNGFGVATTDTTAKRTGWTVGGGIEFAMGYNWLLRAEYLYVDLGTFDAAIACQFVCVDATDTVVHHKYTDNIVRVGVSYKFGGPVVANY
jgi:outer membrane immunogenic protein